MTSHFNRTAVCTVLSGFAFFASVPAVASTATADGQSAIVRTSDLNLATDAGARVLQQRVVHAASNVCGSADIRDLAAMNQMTSCRRVALASAAPQVELAIAEARSGRAYAFNDVRLNALHR